MSRFRNRECRILAQLLESQERVHPVSLIPPMLMRRITQLLQDAGMVPAGDGTWIPTRDTAEWLERFLIENSHFPLSETGDN